MPEEFFFKVGENAPRFQINGPGRKKRNVWSRNPRSSFRPERKRPNGGLHAFLTLNSGYEILAVMNVSHRQVILLFFCHFAPRIVCLITPKSDRLGKHGPYVSKQTFCVFFFFLKEGGGGWYMCLICCRHHLYKYFANSAGNKK